MRFSLPLISIISADCLRTPQWTTGWYPQQIVVEWWRMITLASNSLMNFKFSDFQKLEKSKRFSLQKFLNFHWIKCWKKAGETCTIGTKGKTQCRLSQPQALSNCNEFYKLKTNLDVNENFEYERIRSKTISSARYHNSDLNWEEDPIGNSHLISPSSSLPLIVLHQNEIK